MCALPDIGERRRLKPAGERADVADVGVELHVPPAAPRVVARRVEPGGVCRARRADGPARPSRSADSVAFTVPPVGIGGTHVARGEGGANGRTGDRASRFEHSNRASLSDRGGSCSGIETPASRSTATAVPRSSTRSRVAAAERRVVPLGKEASGERARERRRRRAGRQRVSYGPRAVLQAESGLSAERQTGATLSWHHGSVAASPTRQPPAWTTGRSTAASAGRSRSSA